MRNLEDNTQADTRQTTIELFKENMKFCAAHFTIFSATEREPLHGHNYSVYVALTNWVDANGLSYDYRTYKKLILAVCKQLNQRVILPEFSEYLTINTTDKQVHIEFNHEQMSFCKSDVLILPVFNTTLEELSRWFVNQLTADKARLEADRITQVLVKIYSGPGQNASYTWVDQRAS